MSSQRRLLIVEDDHSHAKLLMLQLAACGPELKVERVVDGEEALAYLRRQPPYEDRPLPDLIILDLNLPKVSGHEVLRKLKTDPELRHLPVVVLSTSSSDRDVSRAYDAGVNSYLVKPLDYDQFRSLIRDLSTYWCTWNQSPEVAA